VIALRYREVDMSEDRQNPQINFSKMQSGAGVAGAMVAILSTLIFLIGIPALRYFLPAAIVLGCVVAVVFRFKRHETPGKPWILVSEKQKTYSDTVNLVDRPIRRVLIPSVRFL